MSNYTEYCNFINWHRNDIQLGNYDETKVDYLEFPVHWERKKPLIEHIFFIFKLYVRQLEKYSKSSYCDSQIVDKNLSDIKRICNLILNAINAHIQQEDVKLSYCMTQIGKIVSNDGNYCLNLKADGSKGVTLFRMRMGKGHNKPEDFFHIPFDKIYLTKQYRFSSLGNPCTYLGYSKEVCAFEMGDGEVSIAKFTMKPECEANILDLTLPDLNGDEDGSTAESQEDKSGNIFRLWPIIAACYVTVPREHENANASFMEEYIFPQLLTRYIQNSTSYDGIRYFTCRNKDLDVSSDRYKNIMFFSKSNLKDAEFNIEKDFQYMVFQEKKDGDPVKKIFDVEVISY